jgi:hypothetical protein
MYVSSALPTNVELQLHFMSDEIVGQSKKCSGKLKRNDPAKGLRLNRPPIDLY